MDHIVVRPGVWYRIFQQELCDIDGVGDLVIVGKKKIPRGSKNIGAGVEVQGTRLEKSRQFFCGHTDDRSASVSGSIFREGVDEREVFPRSIASGQILVGEDAKGAGGGQQIMKLLLGIL